VRRSFAVLVVLFVVLAAGSGDAARAGDWRPEIEVTHNDPALPGNLEEVVGNPANAWTVVRIRPGTYGLRAEMRLQPGMCLAGSQELVDADGDLVPDVASDGSPVVVAGTHTVIDGTSVAPPTFQRTDCNGNVFTATEPLIAFGKWNRIARLTIQGASIPVGESSIPIGDGDIEVEVTECVLTANATGTTRSLTFANSGCAARGARSVLVLTRSVVRNGEVGVTIANLIAGDVGNSTANGPVLHAILGWNRITGRIAGVTAFGGAFGTDGASIRIDSIGNIYEKCSRTGILLMGGRGNGIADPVNENSIRFLSIRDTLRANGTGALADRAQVSLYGAELTRADADVAGNRLGATLWYPRFERGGAPVDVRVYGANLGGSGNTADVSIHAATVVAFPGAEPVRGTITFRDNQPATLAPPVPNVATVKGWQGKFDRVD